MLACDTMGLLFCDSVNYSVALVSLLLCDSDVYSVSLLLCWPVAMVVCYRVCSVSLLSCQPVVLIARYFVILSVTLLFC